MSAARTVAQVRADAERFGRSGECELDEHSFCHPQDVYVSGTPFPGERPVFSLRCACACHNAPPPEGR
ncbi:hypothetical protein [Streptomyces sp. MUM 178J]|uniref:hypothetical protein n=1 Tax=Streptomyces sp. MUM 178J TaxID=2791991 RepID=UPI001F033F5F|nr:hypothetical protein [Streptomyces sp. MUM 178J]WRQ80290.1 hypothetical protein I3F59_013535 [Streptomyces sp. MUM 178J]